MSCASAGNCSAGGYYWNPTTSQAFVVSQVHGTWGNAMEVPGTAALNRGGDAVGQLGVVRFGGQLQRRRVLHRRSGARPGVRGQPGERHLGQRRARCPARPPSTPAVMPRSISVSCASAGNCSAGGRYTDSLRPLPGVRGQPGERRLGQRRARCPAPPRSTRAGCARSTRCRAPRRATAAPAGTTRTPPATRQAFVVSQVNGTWGNAKQVPGTAALNAGRLSPWSLGVVRLGGQLQRRRGLQRLLQPPARRSWSAR